jgi:hypothetical protein
MTTSPPDIPLTDAEIARHISVRIDALKLIKDYSAAIVVVQTALIAVIGAMLRLPAPSWLNALAIVLLATLIGSIYVGAVTIAGTVPYIVQTLADNPRCSIYDQAGGIRRGWLAKRPLGALCLLQAHLFVAGLLLFAWFALSR